MHHLFQRFKSICSKLQQCKETGLYYFGARYYDPIIGRFISPDSLVQSYQNPQTLNRYSYALNNPLLYRDPNGEANTLFHMIIDFPGATLGWLLGSAPNPFKVARENWNLDMSDMRSTSKDRLQVHANAWEIRPASGVYATRGEALSAAWGSFRVNLGNSETVWEANHTFYDILTHWGSEWTPFSFRDPSTWLGGATHFVFNDIILVLLRQIIVST